MRDVAWKRERSAITHNTREAIKMGEIEGHRLIVVFE